MNTQIEPCFSPLTFLMFFEVLEITDLSLTIGTCFPWCKDFIENGCHDELFLAQAWVLIVLSVEPFVTLDKYSYLKHENAFNYKNEQTLSNRLVLFHIEVMEMLNI